MSIPLSVIYDVITAHLTTDLQVSLAEKGK
jgi:hypothetical protein